MTRTWELQEGGTAFHGRLQLTNTTANVLSDSFVETIPKSLAESVDVSFSPAVDAVVARDPVVRYELRELGPGSTASFAYDVTVAKGGDAFERLKAWADDQADASGARSGVSLASLSVSPEAVTLSAAQRFPLRVRGSMSDKTRAPPAVFSGLSWSAADPKVVAVANGTLTAVGPGTTEVTAQAGGLTAKVTVKVGGGAVPAPQPSSTVAEQNRRAPTTRRPAPTTAPPPAGSPTTTASQPVQAPTTGTTTTPPPPPPPPPLSSIGAYYTADGRWSLRSSISGAGGADTT